MREDAEPMTGEPGASVRGRLAADADANYDRIKGALLNALDATHHATLSCPYCKKRSEVEVPNTREQVNAATALLKEGFGRPDDQKETAQASLDRARANCQRDLRSLSNADLLEMVVLSRQGLLKEAELLGVMRAEVDELEGDDKPRHTVPSQAGKKAA